MSYFYSDLSRESDPHVLPDVEVFEVTECYYSGLKNVMVSSLDDHEPGWYAVQLSELSNEAGEPS